MKPTRRNAYALILLLMAFGSLAEAPLRAQAPPPSAYVVDSFAGTSPGSEAFSLTYPTGIAFGADGSLYVADRGNHKIRKITVDGVASTIAGGGGQGKCGDGGAAANACLDAPHSLAVGPDGSVYFSEMGSQRVRRIAPDGVITTVAGDGVQRFRGDGGPATQASFDLPAGVTTDEAGNLYIADSANHRVRKVGLDGKIQTVAGNGNCGYSGDGGPATKAEMCFPRDVKLDTLGNLYVAELMGYVRRVAPDGKIVTLAGGGNENIANDADPLKLSLPYLSAIEVDKNRRVYITADCRIGAVEPSGTTTLLAGTGKCAVSGDGGPAVDAETDTATGFALAADGSLYFSDNGAGVIRRITPQRVIHGAFGTAGWQGDGGAANRATMKQPSGVAAGADGSLYVADAGHHAVRQVLPDGGIRTIAGNGQPAHSGDGGPATAAQLNQPTDVAINAVGTIYIADRGNHCVRAIDGSGTIRAYAGTCGAVGGGGGNAAASDTLSAPQGLALDMTGKLYVADGGNHRVWVVSTAGVLAPLAGNGTSGLAGDGGPALQAQLNDPMDIDVGPDGSVYIADHGNRRLRRVTPEGMMESVSEEEVAATGIALPGGRCCLVTDDEKHRLSSFLGGGEWRHSGTETPGFRGNGQRAGGASFSSPKRLAAGADGTIFVADAGNHCVRVLKPAPEFAAENLLNAASFARESVAPGSIFSLFGWNLATSTLLGDTLPLPTALAGTEVAIIDSAGSSYFGEQFFVSPFQLNLYVPADAHPGPATVRVTNSFGYEFEVEVNFAQVAPGLFAANANGQGLAAAGAVRVKADLTQEPVAIFAWDAAQGKVVPVSIDLGPEGDQIYLVLYGTGLRGESNRENFSVTIGGVSVPVHYAGPQGDFVGLDQLNIGPIPRSLAGAGEVTIVVTVNGQASNTVTVSIR